MKSLWLDTSQITNGELADLIAELKLELNQRKARITGDNWLRVQLDRNALEVRSWTRQKRKNAGLK